MFANEHKIDYENISWFMQGNYVESNVEFQCGISIPIETRWVIESQAWANYRWRFKRTNFMSTFDICVWNFQILSTFACCALNKTNKYLLPWFCFRTFVRLLSLHFPWVFFRMRFPKFHISLSHRWIIINCYDFIVFDMQTIPCKRRQTAWYIQAAMLPSLQPPLQNCLYLFDRKRVYNTYTMLKMVK